MKDLPLSQQEIADRLAINNVLDRYVHALDTRQYDVLDDVFLPDCSFDLSQAGRATATWHEVKQFYETNLLDAFPHYLHVYVNVLIVFDSDRTEARSVSKVLNPAGRMGSDGVIHHFETFGHVHDDWARTGDGWRITRRRWENLWISGDYPFEHLPGEADNRGSIAEQSEEVAMYVHGAFGERSRVAPEIGSIAF